MGLDGSNFRRLFSLPQDSHAYSLLHHVGATQEALIWSDWGKGGLMWAPLGGASPTPVVLMAGFTAIEDIESRAALPSCGGTPACGGHGTCTASGCLCAPGYTGAQCQTALPRLECPSGCSGHGTCNPYTGTCACNAQYTGSGCQWMEGLSAPCPAGLAWPGLAWLSLAWLGLAGDCDGGGGGGDGGGGGHWSSCWDAGILHVHVWVRARAAKSICPDSAYHTLSGVRIFADGRSAVIEATGYNATLAAISNSNPALQADEACHCTELEIVADPDRPCETRLRCAMDVDVIKRCPDVSRAVSGNVEIFSFTLHVGSQTWVMTDPRGHPVIRTPFQPIPMSVRRTLTASASVRFISVAGVQWAEHELRTTYFDREQRAFIADFMVWLNRPYTHGDPVPVVVPARVLPSNVVIERTPAADDCPQAAVTCGHAYRMRIINADSACGLDGTYTLQTLVTCADPTVCPEIRQRYVPVEVTINPGADACGVRACARARESPSHPPPLAPSPKTWCARCLNANARVSSAPLPSLSPSLPPSPLASRAGVARQHGGRLWA